LSKLLERQELVAAIQLVLCPAMEEHKYEYVWDGFGEHPWLVMSRVTERNFTKAVEEGDMEVTIYEGAGIGRKWLFADPPTADGPWRLYPKNKAKNQQEPMVVRTVVTRVFQCVPTLLKSGAYQISLTNILTGDHVKDVIARPAQSIGSCIDELRDVFEANAVKLVYNDEPVMVVPRMTLKKLFQVVEVTCFCFFRKLLFVFSATKLFPLKEKTSKPKETLKRKRDG
jgi:hypothetical protein